MNFSKGLKMAKSYAVALASRGLSNKKTEPYTKRLRVLSCFGNQNIGGELPQCEHLQKSKVKLGKFYCGGCGCGDRKGTWLVAEGDEYSKLDYPVLNCPLNMPGFSDYTESSPDEGISPITRRYYIEQMDENEINKVMVSDLEVPESVLKALEENED